MMVLQVGKTWDVKQFNSEPVGKAGEVDKDENQIA